MIKLFKRTPPPDGPCEKRFSGKISPEYIASIFSDCYDFENREITISGGRRVHISFIDGLTSGSAISETVIKPLLLCSRLSEAGSDSQLALMLSSRGVFGSTVHTRTDADKVVTDLLNGCCAVVLNGAAVTVEVKSADKRSVSEPKEEKVLKGAKDAFTESVKTNTALVRRHLRTPDMRLRSLTVGRRSKTAVAVVWLEGLTNRRLAERVIERIGKIDTDGLITSSALEETICDRPFSPFPQLDYTERTDKFCLSLLAGQVGILCDGLPMGFTAPVTLAAFFKTPEDRSQNYITASALTLLRYFACILTLFLPAVFTAISMYHQEMLPAKLLQSMISAKQEVPFPTAAEVLLMLISLELLQEAGIRLPSSIGQTVSIIGALIVGQAAVEAKIVSPIAVIIIALSGIAGYTVPNQDLSNALRIWRMLLLLAAIIAGMFGIAITGAALLLHLCSLESLGVPYMSPLAGKYGGQQLLRLLRPPLQAVKSRSRALETENERSQR